MGVPKHFWHMIVLIATYIINRTLSRVLQGKAQLHILQPANIPRCPMGIDSPPSLSSASEMIMEEDSPSPRPLPILESPSISPSDSLPSIVTSTSHRSTLIVCTLQLPSQHLLQLQDMGMLGCRHPSTLMVPNLKISAEIEELLPDPSIYQQLVGRLVYLTNIRLDLTFVVSAVSQFMHSPRTYHLDAMYHILWYLKTCHSLRLFYKFGVQSGLSCFINTDYAESKSDRRSTSGFYTFRGSHLIS
ncbi:cysteine-rich RECEPTOR-like kinase [Actinidia rufa]|uniref:Cysteine-rich RECEPTOR-like kinase n=1 Tax=Actinidia rufa TaxID=165716 RepID=A0A7J0DQJ4_9ERIC|nr:cysteine-rich RECEPTOR-like kinase [Actinidia rufa]